MSQAGINSVGSVTPGVIQTLTGNTGGAVGPDASHNINLTGATLYTVDGTPASHALVINPRSNAYPITPYVVGPVGKAGYQTIQSALDAAHAAGGQTWVYVLPQGSPYTENLTLYDGVGISGAIGQVDSKYVQVIGTHTPPLSGQFTAYGIWFTGTTSCFNSNAAGTATFNFFNVIVEITGTGYTWDMPNWNGQINIFDFLQTDTGTNGFLNNPSGTTGVVIINSAIGLTQKNATAIINGFVEWDNMLIAIKCQYGGNNYININGGCLFLNTQIFTGSSFTTIVDTSFQTGSNPAILYNSSGNSYLADVHIDSSATPVIDGSGAGNLKLGSVTYTTNSGIANTINKTYTSSLESGVGFFQNLSFDRGTTTVSTNGQLIIGKTGANPVIANLTQGPGITITNGAGSIAIAAAGGGFLWSDQAGNFTASKSNGYFCTAALTATLPSLAAEGDTIVFVADTASTVTITANTGQKIRLSSSLSAAAGTAASTAQGDTLTLTFRSSSLVWIAHSAVGNWTIT